MTLKEKKEELLKVREEILKCSLCPLCKTRTQSVPGEGNPDSDVIFIGEGPGANEDKEGIPFCGAAGKFLSQMLSSIGLNRDDVFITNTVKCRPPENRDPLDSEKEACRHFLKKQIEIIKPKIIVLLGKHATKEILGKEGISKLHGKFFRKKDNIIYLPLYHPAAALYNGSMRDVLLNDFLKIDILLKKIKEETTDKEEIENLKQERLIN